MTLPFENDTNAVVKKLAKQNISKSQNSTFYYVCHINCSYFFMYLMYSYSELLESESATGNF